MSPESSPKPRSLSNAEAALDMLLVTLLWGAFFVVGKLSVHEGSPLVVATLRFALASVVLVGLLAWREPDALRPSRQDLGLALGLGLTGVALYNGLAFYAFAHAPASDGAMISPSLNPVVTSVAAAILFGERLGRARVLGLIVALVGITLVFGGPALESAATPERLWGDVLFVGSGLAWSAYTLVGKLTVGRLSALASTTYAAVAGLALLLPVSWPELARTAWSRLSLGFWASIVFLALGSTVAAFLLWYRALAKIGAARTASWLPLVPVFGVGLGVATLGERPTPVQLTGMALAVLGVWVANRR
jgi:drug/metabolite transporter (DMT)-like permease